MTPAHLPRNVVHFIEPLRPVLCVFFFAALVFGSLALPAFALAHAYPFLPERMMGMAGLALFFGLVSLIVIWVVFGPSRAAARLLGFVFCAALLALVALLAWGNTRDNGTNWADDVAIIGGLQAFVLLSVLSLARLRGVRMERTLPADSRERVASRRPVQYAIRDLALFTAGAAVLLAVARSIRVDAAWSQNVSGNMIAIFGAFCAFAFDVIALAALWLTFGRGWWWMRLVLVAAITFSLCAEVDRWFGFQLSELRAYFIGAMVVHGLFVAGALALIRAHGYRLEGLNHQVNSGVSPVSNEQSTVPGAFFVF